ncbi:MAG: amidohydrolase family protein [Bacillota bacterium]
MPVPVIDFHVHPCKYDTMYSWVTDWMESNDPDFKKNREHYSEPANFVELLRQSGVDYAVILGELSPITTGLIGNEQVAEFCRGYECLIPFANINPFMSNDPARELETLYRQDGFRGLKLYPTYQWFYPNDPMLYRLYAKAEELQVPIMLHTGSSIFRGSKMKYGDPLFLDDVAVDFPDLPILLVHSGRGFWYDRAFFLAGLHKNIYMEISGLPPQKLFTYFPEFPKNAHKTIFGSDWPGMPHIKRNIAKIRDLPLTEEAKTQILGGNAARILGLTV